MGVINDIYMTKVQEKLDYWAAQLRDMGRRNHLLFFKETKSSTLIIEEPNIIDIFNRLVVKNKPIFSPLFKDKQIYLFDEDKEEKDDQDNDDQDNDRDILFPLADDEFLCKKNPKQVNRVLKNLRYRSRTIREEQGFNSLYMAFGVLKWQEGIDSEFNEAPLILVPIDITQQGLLDRIGIEMFEEEIIFNPSLQTKLSKEFNIEINDINNDISQEELEKFWSIVAEKVKGFDGWEVLPKIVIGIFNFQNLILIKDLERNSEIYINNPLIKLLSGIDLKIDPIDVIIDEDLDKKVSPVNVFQILDADSSQQEAIEAAKRGLSFVLQGPPGTGKSQTIANIIAESFASGKKILFVSQKSVALDIVHNRLSENGLGEFCLEVHSYKKNKKDVIEDLGKSLYTIKGESKVETAKEKRELVEIRKELNNYVKELHKPRFGMEMSLFSAFGELAKAYDEPKIPFSLDNIENIQTFTHRTNISTIREIVSYESLVKDYHNLPWKGICKNTLPIQEKEEIEQNFYQMAEVLSSFSQIIMDWVHYFSLIIPSSFSNYKKLYQFITTYHPKIFSEEYHDVVDRFLERKHSKLKYFLPQYWKDRSLLIKLQWQDIKISEEENLKLFLIYKQFLRPSNKEDRKTDKNYEKITSDINEIKIAYELVIELLDYSKNLFKENAQPDVLVNFFNFSPEKLIDWFTEKALQVELIPEFINFRNAIYQGKKAGLSDFINKAFETNLLPHQWEDAYKRRFFVLLSDAMIQSNSILIKFRSSEHENLRSRFKQLDNKLIELAALEIREKLYKTRPGTSWVEADSAETSILRRELNKKRRIKPLRILFSEIPNLLFSLKPCLMMSPFTVCQLLDPELYEFDIAIFDEASQIPPEYAVSTFVRAKQVIVAGDRYQLPPTSFFQTIDTYDYDEDNYDIDDYESILNACDAINMPNKMLLWHYRSEDESLIAFSNYHFYDNHLFTFPNSNLNRDLTGLDFIYVEDGIYRRGKGGRDNPIEARKVAEIVFASLETHPEWSIGVVTFNLSQRQTIEQEIEKLKRERPEIIPLFDYDKSEHVFVKNLETVQGDERDIIIFSIGYGKDEMGEMSMNFGPLNRQGGERRLNVAVTRAKKAVKIVSSIEPEDIDLSRTESIGVKLLKNYMETARDGLKSIYKDVTYNSQAEFESPFEAAIYDSLTRRGVILENQVGVSKYRIDFGVKDPEKHGRYILGIECDGATYHSSPTARDRDRLRQQLLEEKFGWRIHRIWSRDWIENKQKEIEKVLLKIQHYSKESPNKDKKKLKSHT